MAGRASIVGAAVTHVGNVREHNEDAHFFDADLGLFLVCDGMGGHAAGEVASAIAIQTIRKRWADDDTAEVADVWLDRGTAIAKKQLIEALRDGVIAAHNAIIAEGVRDPTKQGMGTTLVAAIVVGNELIFAHAGDSRAYIVRDGISMQLTEDHTLLQRLLAAGIDVDVSGDGARFRSMLTNALGIGQECKVSTFVVPLADGDRFMLCSDGISEYVLENEVGDVLVKQPSPARAAQKLVDLALERGGGDNATAIVMRVLEAGETPVPAEQRRRDDLSISLCELWSEKVSPQQRLRALRIAIPRDHVAGERLPAHTLGDRVAWIIVEGEVTVEGEPAGPGAFIYPESLVAGSSVPDKDGLAVARTDVRAVAIRNDDFRELTEDDAELGEALLESLAAIIGARTPRPMRAKPTVDPYATTLSHAPTDPNIQALDSGQARRPAQNLGRAATPPAGMPTQPVIGRAPTPLADNPALGRALTPPAGKPASYSEPEISITRLAADADDAEHGAEAQLAQMTRDASRRPARLITEPEIETVVEMEADEPTGSNDSGDHDDHAEHLMISVSTDDGSAKIIETVTDSSSATMRVTVEEPTRTRPVTADDAAQISGTIEQDRSRVSGTPSSRHKRASDD
ncbi:MAG: serine/threonine-protein phosphatase [Myxococcales bacterium]|nr:serine/threonine-protein phosphatase [Myxococcales bacterium]